MKLFTIDESKCTRCNLCAIDCPRQIIQPSDKKSVPTVISGESEYCIDCGHCVAICPTGAFSLQSMKESECPEITKKLLPGAAQMEEFLKSRRSVRRFKDKKVSREELSELIDVARHAPTGSNKQMVEWTVFEESKKVHKLASLVVDWSKSLGGKIPDEKTAKKMARVGNIWDGGHDSILHGSPHLILVHAQENLLLVEADCAIAMTYLELYAASRGLGTCWAGYLHTAANSYAPLSEELNLPEGHKCFGAIMIGYPKYGYKLIPERKKAIINWK